MPTSLIALVQDSLKHLTISSVVVAILAIYYQGESTKWEERQKLDEKRWQQLFEQYAADQKSALETIRTCCRERGVQYLESR